MFSHRPSMTQDFEEISKFPQDARELFYMYPKGKYPISAEELEEVAKIRIKPTVILHEHKVIGYCNFYEVSEESSWLGNLIIKPSYRGTGAGKYLIETMKEYAGSEFRVKNFRTCMSQYQYERIIILYKTWFQTV